MGGLAAHLITYGVTAAPAITQLYPTTGSGGPWVIAVLSDAYGDGIAQTIFENDAKNLFVEGLLKDDNFKAWAPMFTIKAIHNPFPSTDPANPPLNAYSNYGFKSELSGDCEVSSMGNATAAAVEKVAAAVNPKRIAVLGNYTLATGCTDFNWTYLYTRANARTVAHEFGHLVAGLYDEYVLHTGSDPDAPITTKNCSTNLSSPHWTTLGLGLIAPFPTGCDTWSTSIARPTDTCLMKDYGLFCKVCKYYIGRALIRKRPLAPTNLRIYGAGFVPQPRAQPTPVEQRSVRVLILVRRGADAAEALTATEVGGPIYPETTREGDYLYEVRDGQRTIATGTLVGDPFEKRAYSKSREPHSTSHGDTATLTVTIPFQTIRTLRDRTVEVDVYRFTDAREREVTVENIGQLKREGLIQRISTLRADDLKKSLR